MSAEDEQQLLRLLAIDKWTELSNAVKESCLNAKTVRVEFEETPTRLIAKRIENGWAAKVLTLIFNGGIPCVEWKCCDPRPQSGAVDIRLYGREAFYVVRGVNTPLPDVAFILTSCVTT